MEDISPYYVKATHGTALKMVIEESALLGEFTTMIKKKLMLDEQHLKNLIALRTSWNVKWREGNIAPLLSPVLTHFDDEIKNLNRARKYLKDLWKDLPGAHVLEPEEQRGFNPFEMPEILEKLFVPCKESHDTVSTPARKKELRDWYSTNRLAGILPGMKLPQIDRTYRAHVVAQHRYVEKARKWYTHDMRVIIERHQQRAEDIKRLLHASLLTLNDLLSESLISCSSAVHSINSFASTWFIGASHEEFEQELTHVLLQRFDYHSYYRTDKGEISEPVFGLGIEDMVAFVGLILDCPKLEWEAWPHCITWLEYHCGIDHMLQTERRLLQKSNMRELLEEDCDQWPGYAILYMQYALWYGPPLLPISDQQVTQYQHETPVKRTFSFGSRRSPEILLRQKMELVTKLADSTIPSQVARLVSRLLAGIMNTTNTPPMEYTLTYASSILTHSTRTQVVIKDVWRKWNFIQGCPLKVERDLYSDNIPAKKWTNFLDTLRALGPDRVYLDKSSASGYIGGFVDWRYRIGKFIKEARYLIKVENIRSSTRKWAIHRMEFEGVDMVTQNRIILKMMCLQQSDRSQDLSGFQSLTMRELENSNVEKEQEAYSGLSLIDNVPRVHYSGKYGITRCLVIDHCGPDLGSLFRKCGHQFSVKTVAMIAKQMISLVEAMHLENVIISYTNIQNFAFRKKEDGKEIVHITDFVLQGEKPFRFIYPHPLIIGSLSTGDVIHKVSTQSELHSKMIEDLEVIGRHVFCFKGSLAEKVNGYLFVYFLRGSFPLQDLHLLSLKGLYSLLKRMEWAMSIESLTQGLPEQFLTYFDHIHKFDISQFPNHQCLCNLFQDILEGIGELDDSVFDWNTLENEGSTSEGTMASFIDTRLPRIASKLYEH